MFSGLLSGCAAAGPAVRTREERDDRGVLLHTQSYYLVKDRGELESVLHGPQIDWFPNGERHRVTEFAHGVRHGRTVEWSRDGAVVRDERFVDGEMAGADGAAAKVFVVEQPAVHSRFRGWGGGTVDYEQHYDARGGLVGVVTRSRGVNVARCIRSDPGADGRYRRSDWAYWDPHGKLLGSGVFRDGKPWEGVCFISIRGGSIGRQEFGRYQAGRLIERVPAPVLALLGETPIPPAERK
jgi:hypothetical protein